MTDDIDIDHYVELIHDRDKEIESLRAHLEERDGTLQFLQNKLTETEKDAKRYRWLRLRVPGSSYRIMGIIYSEGEAGVDEQIDAAIAKQKG